MRESIAIERPHCARNRKIMEEHMPSDLLNEYRQAFQIVDRKNVGKISLRDLSTVTCSIGIQLTEAELHHYVTQVTGATCHLLDDCVIDFADFLSLMALILTECISGEEVLKIFQEFDRDGDGFISPHELKALLSRYGDHVTDQEVEAMMDEADKDRDGKVSLREFINVMSTSSLMHTRILQNLQQDADGAGVHECAAPAPSERRGSAPELPSPVAVHCDHEPDRECDGAALVPKSRARRRMSLVDWIKHKSAPRRTSAPENGAAGSSSDAGADRKRRKSGFSRTLTLTRDLLMARNAASGGKLTSHTEE